ncbi:hypothetical protein [Streptomyces jumonjinensis]|uniref:hypothetical protein n=1 Tax=Streptomyces jumonjinensis TaxID=1945 RepID=UPI001E30683F|nr:hypothetical protein [Streptomyces jumonjinensis]
MSDDFERGESHACSMSTRVAKRPRLEKAVTLVVHEHERLGRGIEPATLAGGPKAGDIGLEFLTAVGDETRERARERPAPYPPLLSQWEEWKPDPVHRTGSRPARPARTGLTSTRLEVQR